MKSITAVLLALITFSAQAKDIKQIPNCIEGERINIPSEMVGAYKYASNPSYRMVIGHDGFEVVPDGVGPSVEVLLTRNFCKTHTVTVGNNIEVKVSLVRKKRYALAYEQESYSYSVIKSGNKSQYRVGSKGTTLLFHIIPSFSGGFTMGRLITE